MIVSSVLTVLFSLVFGIIGIVSGGNFLSWFLFALVSQFILFFIVNLCIKTYSQIQVNKLEVSRLNSIDRNIKQLRCAVCGEINDVYINVNSDKNEFICSKCGSKNKVIVYVDTVQKTEIFDGVITDDTLKKIVIKESGEKDIIEA